jgi:hypothetical protein
MSIVEFRPYKRLSNDKLLYDTCKEISKLRSLSNQNNLEEYWKEARIVNDMIIEVKRRNLKLDKETLIRKILITNS